MLAPHGRVSRVTLQVDCPSPLVPPLALRYSRPPAHPRRIASLPPKCPSHIKQACSLLHYLSIVPDSKGGTLQKRPPTRRGGIRPFQPQMTPPVDRRLKSFVERLLNRAFTSLLSVSLGLMHFLLLIRVCHPDQLLCALLRPQLHQLPHPIPPPFVLAPVPSTRSHPASTL